MKNILLFSIFFISCNKVINITINKDGSALVKEKMILLYKDDILLKDSTLTKVANFVGEKSSEGYSTVGDDYDSFYKKSKIIHKYKSVSNKRKYFESSYFIDNIDSLGYYLYQEDSILVPEFIFTKDEFYLKCYTEENTYWNEDYYDGIFIDLNIKFPNKIMSVDCNNLKVNYKFKKNKLWISSNLRPLFYSKNPTIIIVHFNAK